MSISVYESHGVKLAVAPALLQTSSHESFPFHRKHVLLGCLFLRYVLSGYKVFY